MSRRKFIARIKKCMRHIKRHYAFPSLDDGSEPGEAWIGFTILEGFALEAFLPSRKAETHFKA
jgi:hypothetical protein